MKYLNRILLQWLFLRLTKCSEKIIVDYNLISYDLLPNGNIGSRGTGKIIEKSWYALQGFVLPLSGYNNDQLKYIGKKWFFNLTPKK